MLPVDRAENPPGTGVELTMEPSPQRHCPECGTPVAQRAETCLMCGAALKEEKKRQLPAAAGRPAAAPAAGRGHRRPVALEALADRDEPQAMVASTTVPTPTATATATRHPRRPTSWRLPLRPSTRPRRRRPPPCRPTRPATPSSRARPCQQHRQAVWHDHRKAILAGQWPQSEHRSSASATS